MFIDTEKGNWGDSWEVVIIILIIPKAMGSAVKTGKGLQNLWGESGMTENISES